MSKLPENKSGSSPIIVIIATLAISSFLPFFSSKIPFNIKEKFPQIFYLQEDSGNPYPTPTPKPNECNYSGQKKCEGNIKYTCRYKLGILKWTDADNCCSPSFDGCGCQGGVCKVKPTPKPTPAPRPTPDQCQVTSDCAAEGRCNVSCSGRPKKCHWTSCPAGVEPEAPGEGETGSGPVSYGCFLKGTKIRTADGLKNIEEIKREDKLVSFNLNTLKEEIAASFELSSHKVNGFYYLLISDYSSQKIQLRVTSEHPIFTLVSPQADFSQAQFVKVKDLKKDDLVKTDKFWGVIIEKKYYDLETLVYNLVSVSPWENFFANGVLVHNKAVLSPPLQSGDLGDEIEEEPVGIGTTSSGSGYSVYNENDEMGELKLSQRELFQPTAPLSQEQPSVDTGGYSQIPPVTSPSVIPGFTPSFDQSSCSKECQQSKGAGAGGQYNPDKNEMGVGGCECACVKGHWKPGSGYTSCEGEEENQIIGECPVTGEDYVLNSCVQQVCQGEKWVKTQQRCTASGRSYQVQGDATENTCSEGDSVRDCHQPVITQTLPGQESQTTVRLPDGEKCSPDGKYIYTKTENQSVYRGIRREEDRFNSKLGVGNRVPLESVCFEKDGQAYIVSTTEYFGSGTEVYSENQGFSCSLSGNNIVDAQDEQNSINCNYNEICSKEGGYLACQKVNLTDSQLQEDYIIFDSQKYVCRQKTKIFFQDLRQRELVEVKDCADLGSNYICGRQDGQITCLKTETEVDYQAEELSLDQDQGFSASNGYSCSGTSGIINNRFRDRKTSFKKCDVGNICTELRINGETYFKCLDKNKDLGLKDKDIAVNDQVIIEGTVAENGDTDLELSFIPAEITDNSVPLLAKCSWPQGNQGETKLFEPNVFGDSEPTRYKCTCLEDGSSCQWKSLKLVYSVEENCGNHFNNDTYFTASGCFQCQSGQEVLLASRKQIQNYKNQAAIDPRAQTSISSKCLGFVSQETRQTTCSDGSQAGSVYCKGDQCKACEIGADGQTSSKTIDSYDQARIYCPSECALTNTTQKTGKVCDEAGNLYEFTTTDLGTEEKNYLKFCPLGCRNGACIEGCLTSDFKMVSKGTIIAAESGCGTKKCQNDGSWKEEIGSDCRAEVAESLRWQAIEEDYQEEQNLNLTLVQRLASKEGAYTKSLIKVFDADFLETEGGQELLERAQNNKNELLAGDVMSAGLKELLRTGQGSSFYDDGEEITGLTSLRPYESDVLEAGNEVYDEFIEACQKRDEGFVEQVKQLRAISSSAVSYLNRPYLDNTQECQNMISTIKHQMTGEADNLGQGVLNFLAGFGGTEFGDQNSPYYQYGQALEAIEECNQASSQYNFNWELKASDNISSWSQEQKDCVAGMAAAKKARLDKLGGTDELTGSAVFETLYGEGLGDFGGGQESIRAAAGRQQLANAALTIGTMGVSGVAQGIIKGTKLASTTVAAANAAGDLAKGAGFLEKIVPRAVTGLTSGQWVETGALSVLNYSVADVVGDVWLATKYTGQMAVGDVASAAELDKLMDVSDQSQGNVVLSGLASQSQELANQQTASFGSSNWWGNLARNAGYSLAFGSALNLKNIASDAIGNRVGTFIGQIADSARGARELVSNPASSFSLAEAVLGSSLDKVPGVVISLGVDGRTILNLPRGLEIHAPAVDVEGNLTATRVIKSSTDTKLIIEPASDGNLRITAGDKTVEVPEASLKSFIVVDPSSENSRVIINAFDEGIGALEKQGIQASQTVKDIESLLGGVEIASVRVVNYKGDLPQIEAKKLTTKVGETLASVWDNTGGKIFRTGFQPEVSSISKEGSVEKLSFWKKTSDSLNKGIDDIKSRFSGSKTEIPVPDAEVVLQPEPVKKVSFWQGAGYKLAQGINDIKGRLSGSERELAGLKSIVNQDKLPSEVIEAIKGSKLGEPLDSFIRKNGGLLTYISGDNVYLSDGHKLVHLPDGVKVSTDNYTGLFYIDLPEKMIIPSNDRVSLINLDDSVKWQELKGILAEKGVKLPEVELGGEGPEPVVKPEVENTSSNYNFGYKLAETFNGIKSSLGGGGKENKPNVINETLERIRTSQLQKAQGRLEAKVSTEVQGHIVDDIYNHSLRLKQTAFSSLDSAKNFADYNVRERIGLWSQLDRNGKSDIYKTAWQKFDQAGIDSVRAAELATQIEKGILANQEQLIQNQLKRIDFKETLVGGKNVYSFGDIHGDYEQFEKLAKGQLKNDQGETLSEPILNFWGRLKLGPNDEVYIHGDLIDRSPVEAGKNVKKSNKTTSIGTAKAVMELEQQSNGQVKVLLGNHDAAGLTAYHKMKELISSGMSESEAALQAAEWVSPKVIKKGVPFVISPGINSEELLKLYKDPELANWLMSRPAMLLDAQGTIHVHSDTSSYFYYGKKIEDINRNVASILRGEQGADKVADLARDLTSRNGFYSPEKVNLFLERTGGKKIIHAHNEGAVEVDSRVVNVDGGLSRGYKGQARFDEVIVPPEVKVLVNVRGKAVIPTVEIQAGLSPREIGRSFYSLSRDFTGGVQKLLGQNIGSSSDTRLSQLWQLFDDNAQNPSFNLFVQLKNTIATIQIGLEGKYGFNQETSLGRLWQAAEETAADPLIFFKKVFGGTEVKTSGLEGEVKVEVEEKTAVTPPEIQTIRQEKLIYPKTEEFINKENQGSIKSVSEGKWGKVYLVENEAVKVFMRDSPYNSYELEFYRLFGGQATIPEFKGELASSKDLPSGGFVMERIKGETLEDLVNKRTAGWTAEIRDPNGLGFIDNSVDINDLIRGTLTKDQAQQALNDLAEFHRVTGRAHGDLGQTKDIIVEEVTGRLRFIDPEWERFGDQTPQGEMDSFHNYMERLCGEELVKPETISAEEQTRRLGKFFDSIGDETGEGENQPEAVNFVPVEEEVVKTSINFSKLEELKTTAREEVFLDELVGVMQANTGKSLAQAFETGRLGEVLTQVPEAVVKTYNRALNNLAYNQFTDMETRPAIETILNAIDTMDRLKFRTGEDLEVVVKIEIQDGFLKVIDQGEGIALSDLVKLLNPGEGGNLGQAGTVGKFGAGFKSGFYYLKETFSQTKRAGDYIIVKSNTGSEKNFFIFTLGEDGRFKFSSNPLEAEKINFSRGTEVEIHSSLVSKEAILADARKTLEYKTGARLEVKELDTGENYSLNPEDRVKTLTSVEVEAITPQEESVYPALAIKTVESKGLTAAKGEKSEVKILVNGVLMESFYLETLGQPRELALDFHKNFVDYARDRSQIKPSQLTLKALEVTLEEFHSQSPAYFYDNLTLLYQIAVRFKDNALPAKAGIEPADPVALIKEKISRDLSWGYLNKKIVFVEDPELRLAIDPNQEAFFIPKDALSDNTGLNKLNNSIRDKETDFIVYLPLKEEASLNYGLVTNEGILVLDTKLQSLMENPEFRGDFLPVLQALSDVSQRMESSRATGDLIRKYAVLIQNQADLKEKSSLGLLKKRLRITDEEKLARMQNKEDIKLVNEFDRDSLKLLNQIKNNEDYIAALRYIEAAPGYISSFYPESSGYFNFLKDYFSIEEAFEIAKQIKVNTKGEPYMPQFSSEAKAIIEAHTKINSYKIDGSIVIDKEKMKDYWQVIMSSETPYELKKELFSFYVFSQIDSSFRYNLNDYDVRMIRAVNIEKEKINANPIRRLLKGKLLNDYAYYSPTDSKAFIGNDIYEFLVGGKLDTVYDYSENILKKLNGEGKGIGTLSDTFFSMYNILVEKENILLTDKKGMKDAFSRLQEIVTLMLSDLTPSEGNERVKSLEKIFGYGKVENYANLNKGLKTHGSFPQELAPYLHLLYSESPSLGQKPAIAISLPLEKQPIDFSDLIMLQSANQTIADNLTQADNPLQIKDLISEFKLKFEADDLNEIQGRAQAAIKRANEQTVDPFAFLREITTNAYEASRQRGVDSGQVPVFDITAWQDDQGRLVLTMSDNGSGIDLETFITKLAQPNASGWDSEITHFGQGFYTVFSGDEVRLLSTKDGQSLITSLTPLREGNVMTEIKADFSLETAGNRTHGTTLEWVKDTASPQLLASEIWAQLHHYVGLFDNSEMLIRFNGEVINEGAKELVQLTTKSGDVYTFFQAPGEEAFNLNNVFMSTPGEQIIYPVPASVRSILETYGYSINLKSQDLQPLESRSDFVGRKQKIEVDKEIIAEMGVRAAAAIFSTGSVEVKALPDDLFRNIENYRPRDFVLKDAQRLEKGQKIDWLKYIQGDEADKNSLRLLLAIPSLEVEGEKYSFFNAVIKALDDDDFLNKLPLELAEKIIEAKTQNFYGFKLGENVLEKYGLGEVFATPLQPGEPNSEVLAAWQTLVEQALEPISQSLSEKSLVHQFFSSAFPSIAYTNPVGKTVDISWNIPAIYDDLLVLHAYLKADVNDQGQWLTKNGKSLSRDLWHNVWYRILETGYHETAHIIRGESETEWTHNSDFYRFQNELLNRYLESFSKNPQLFSQDKLIGGLQEQFQPTGDKLLLPDRFLKPAESHYMESLGVAVKPLFKFIQAPFKALNGYFNPEAESYNEDEEIARTYVIASLDNRQVGWPLASLWWNKRSTARAFLISQDITFLLSSRDNFFHPFKTLKQLKQNRQFLADLDVGGNNYLLQLTRLPQTYTKGFNFSLPKLKLPKILSFKFNFLIFSDKLDLGYVLKRKPYD